MQIRRKTIHRVALLLGAIAVMLGLYALGRAVTPVTGDGVLPVYAPVVQRTETYRRQAQRWLTHMQDLDGQLLAALTGNQRDLYTQVQRVQQHEAYAELLVQQLELAAPPPALMGAHSGLQNAGALYLEATYAVNRWINEPGETQYLAALEALRLARAAHALAAAHPWLAQSSATPAVTPAVTPATTNAGWGD